MRVPRRRPVPGRGGNPLRRPGRLRDDAGVTLVELLAAMGLMALVGLMATSAVISLGHSLRSTETNGQGQRQLAQAFDRLDKSVRYAADVHVHTRDGNPTVTYVVTSGTPRCGEMWLEHNRLYLRTWPTGAAPPAGVRAAEDVAAPTDRAPFAVANPAADADAPAKRLTVALVAHTSTGATRSLSVDVALPNTVAGPRDVTVTDCL
ncbi:MAG TPA: prepilin-type N-terminal cleavage/methylation domain-containing protein [Pilimelia sp.]|nr:prepilin-type N-terminal cleavage/methylation domain-containing protein [Pilimelia sp.]